jgi:regulator of replication initiation timing
MGSINIDLQIASLRKQIEQLQTELTHSREENEHLHQRLTTTLSRIDILKTTNQVCTCRSIHLHHSPRPLETECSMYSDEKQSFQLF